MKKSNFLLIFDAMHYPRPRNHAVPSCVTSSASLLRSFAPVRSTGVTRRSLAVLLPR